MTATVSGSLGQARVGGEPPLDLVRERDDVDLGAAAGRARDHVGAARAQAERGEDLPGDPYLFDRVAGERHAQRVADALREQRPDAHGALDRPAPQRAGLGDPDVQRSGSERSKRPIRGDRVRDTRALHAELEVDVAPVLELARPREGGLDEGGDGGVARAALRVGCSGGAGGGRAPQAPRQRSGVHADPHRHRSLGLFSAAGEHPVPLGRRAHHLAQVLLAQRARVHAHAGGAAPDRRQGEAPLVVDVGDDRHRRLAHDARERLDLFGRRQTHAYELAARLSEPAHLRERRLGVAGPGAGHGLHHDRRPAPHLDAADADLSRAAHGLRIRPGRRTTSRSRRARRRS